MSDTQSIKITNCKRTYPLHFLCHCSISSFFLEFEFVSLGEGSTNSFIKGQGVNILGLLGHMISVATTQLHCGSLKAAIDNM